MRFPKMKTRSSASVRSAGTKGTIESLTRFSLIRRGNGMKDNTVTTISNVHPAVQSDPGTTPAKAPNATHCAEEAKRDDDEGNGKQSDHTFSQDDVRDAPPDSHPSSSRERETKVTQGKELGKETPAENFGEVVRLPSSLTNDSAEIRDMTSGLSVKSTVMWEDPDPEEVDKEPEVQEVEHNSPAKASLKKAANSLKRKKRKTPDESKIREKHREACKYLKAGNLKMALSEFEEILALLIKCYGENHRRVGAALHNIGIVHIRSGHLDDAIDAIEEAVRVRKETLGDDHPKVADSLVELGIALLFQQEHEDSLEIFNEALEMREHEADEASVCDKVQSTLQVAKILNNIGCVYFEYGALRDALKTYEESLDIQREEMEQFDEKDPFYDQTSLSMASTYCNIGYVHMEMSEWDEAIEVLDEAYATQASTLEFGNKLTLNTLENLAYSNAMHGNNAEALKLYEELLTDQGETLGPKNISCASTRSNIASLHINMCQYQRALRHLTAAEEILVSKLGPNSRRLEKTREMIGCVKYELLKFPTPAEIFNRAMTRGGVHNPFTKTLLCSCGNGEVSEMDRNQFALSRPQLSSKMSGHKVSYA